MDTPDGSQLRPVLGPKLLYVLVVGDVLGAGIYVLVGRVAGHVGGLAWVAFGLAFLAVGATAASYSELVTAHPGAAGSALYVQRAFRQPPLTFVVGLIIIASGLATAATTARAAAGDYLDEIVSVATIPTVVAIVAVLIGIGALGLARSARANLSMTLIEIAGLLIVIVAGVALLIDGESSPAEALELTTGEGRSPISAMLTATALAFFAFLGFEDAVHLSEEVKNPEITFPRVMALAVATTAAVYILVAALAVMTVPHDELSVSDGPLLAIVERGPVPFPPRLFAGVALVAVANTSLLAMVTASRVIYGMAQSGWFPAWFAKLDRRGQTPYRALLGVGAAVAALAVTGDVGELAETAVMLVLGVLIAVNVAALVLRRRPGPRPFSAPWWAPWFGAISCAIVLGQQLLTAPGGRLLRAGVLIAVGVALRPLAAVGRAPATT